MPSPTELAPALDALAPAVSVGLSFGLREAAILLWGLFALSVFPWGAGSRAATLRGLSFLVRLPERLWSRARAEWPASVRPAPARAWSRARA